MDRRPLADTGLAVGRIAFGGTVLGWLVDERASFTLLDGFVASGFNLIDTADSYYVWAPGMKGGESETVIGKWLKQRGGRDRIVIASKVGEPMAGNKGLSRQHILRSADESLARLQSDHIDLYQSHIDDPDTPLDETLEAYDLLIRQGKIRAIGCSNHSAERLSAARLTSRRCGYPRYQVLQTLFNLFDRADFETDLAKLCARENIAVLAYRSLARGFLSGKYRSSDDLRAHARGEGVAHYLGKRGSAILAALDKAAAISGLPMARIAMAWVLSRPQVTAAIAGITRPDQIDDLRAAAELQLAPDLVELLDKASEWRECGNR